MATLLEQLVKLAECGKTLGELQAEYRAEAGIPTRLEVKFETELKRTIGTLVMVINKTLKNIDRKDIVESLRAEADKNVKNALRITDELLAEFRKRGMELERRELIKMRLTDLFNLTNNLVHEIRRRGEVIKKLEEELRKKEVKEKKVEIKRKRGLVGALTAEK
jgi:hypothetical protein